MIVQARIWKFAAETACRTGNGKEQENSKEGEGHAEYFYRRYSGNGEVHFAAGDCRNAAGPACVPGGGLFAGGAGLVHLDDRGTVPDHMEEISGDSERDRGQSRTWSRL